MKLLLNDLLFSTILTQCHSFISSKATIVTFVKDTMMNMTSSQVTFMMKQHLRRLKLHREDNVWAHPRLQAIGHYLLPRNIARTDLKRLTEKMAKNAERN